MPTAKKAAKKTAEEEQRKEKRRPQDSPEASKKVETEMHEMKRGKLRSGSGKKVTNPKQAIAIGLSEARKEGKKVPPKKSSGS